MTRSANDTDVTMAPTNGTRISPSPDRTESSSPAAVCSTSATVPTCFASRRANLQPFELMVVELVRVLDGWQIRGIDEKQRAS